MSDPNNEKIPGQNHATEEEHRPAGNILDEIEMIDIEETIKKYDVESNYRTVAGITAKIVSFLTIAMSLFHLYMAGFGRIPSNKVRAIHLGFVLALVFLLYPMFKKKDKSPPKPSVFDYILAVMGMVVNIYLYLNIDAISMRAGVMYTTDYVMGGIAILLVMEAARRCVGKELAILSGLFLLYAYLGPYLPGALMHRGFGVKRLIDHMYISAEGIYGIPLGTSATIIFLFILFGAFLAESGLSEFFTNISMAVAGHTIGGPAKVSIIASGLLGMINGSAAANVVTTGAFTIPLMKRTGYENHFAGAVEAVASTGGQIMPPVMGAAAFIMAEYLGVPYRTIMITAIIPAILYYVTLWINVHFEAARLGLKGVPKDQLPNAGAEFRQRGHLTIPVFLLIGLMMMNYTPSYAAFYSILCLVAVSFLRRQTHMRLGKLLTALESGAKQSLSVASACAVVGLVVGVVTITGLGLQLANMIIYLSGGILILTLFFTMVACIILGMGMPTSAAYIVAATVASPALTKLGVLPITAHMFVFYFAVLSAITPPVALASYAGAGIADAPPSKVGWTAVRLGLLGFIVPFMYIYSPELLMMGSDPLSLILAFITAVVGCLCLGSAGQGYLLTASRWYERVLMLAAAFLLLDSGMATDIPGLTILAVVYLLQKRRIAQKAAAA
jgi:TRAP transporter 4TM/12TM fusion protein